MLGNFAQYTSKWASSHYHKLLENFRHLRQYKMAQKWKNIQKIINYSEGGIISKVLNSTSKNNVTLFCMAKGTEMTEHTSTREGLIYVVEGKGTFNLEGEDIKMMPDIMIFMPKNAKHSLKAEENTSFVLTLNG